MYRRTFEVLAKWVGDRSKTRVLFDTDGGAHANLKTNEIHLPEQISKDNALGALALLMHEAAHLRHSKKIPMKQVVKCQEDHVILNACEDIRIDRKNFNLLENVYDFYTELTEKHIDLTKSPAPQMIKSLSAGIMINENFDPKMDKATQDVIDNTDLTSRMWDLVSDIEYNRWADLKLNIKKIKKILKITKETPLTQKQKIMLGIEADPNDPNNKNGEPVGMSGMAPEEGLAKDLEDIMRPSNGWGKGEAMKGPGFFGSVDLDEITKQQFKELLCIKERRVIPDGVTLDTDNLVAYYTGDIEELFKEEKIVKQKKSKILFLIDASGSMSSPLMDRKRRVEVVKRCVTALTDILEEVRATESIDVDWAVAGFDDSYYRYKNETWENEYGAGGGTDIKRGVRGALDDLMKDHTVEGKRILVIFSDGDVSSDDIDMIKKMIISKGSDIRTLVVGVGTQLTGRMATEIVGDNIILTEADSSFVLMETVKEML